VITAPVQIGSSYIAEVKGHTEAWMKINGEGRVRSVEVSAHGLETQIEIGIAQADVHDGAGACNPGFLRCGRCRAEQKAREQLDDNFHNWVR